ncbi:hypothetical protein GBAR_LOCUS16566 [Geodia barretti]|uniref:Uncharacterized protein n=1 Tax=Geodia barretti TaxID=519541 RepID=A0AA35WU88_GEOBA|nr:hypothetical protein GBAR_LOCUS16566 [Geodia barretti]
MYLYGDEETTRDTCFFFRLLWKNSEPENYILGWKNSFGQSQS